MEIPAKIVEGLKPGGLVVVEGFSGDAAQAGMFGSQPNELPRALGSLRITHYQELIAPADWSGGRPQPRVRFVARKQ
jgi:hypothetical protein